MSRPGHRAREVQRRSAAIIAADSVMAPRLSTCHGGAAQQAVPRSGLNARRKRQRSQMWPQVYSTVKPHITPGKFASASDFTSTDSVVAGPGTSPMEGVPPVAIPDVITRQMHQLEAQTETLLMQGLIDTHRSSIKDLSSISIGSPDKLAYSLSFIQGYHSILYDTCLTKIGKLMFCRLQAILEGTGFRGAAVSDSDIEEEKRTSMSHVQKRAKNSDASEHGKEIGTLQREASSPL
ncbi:hypothetical protein DFH08DRAFT_800196 [Mycena albidolilacea]|uniref:Uncharacterized protein n=1 Tax=Mycena albidolilacea TaxID=1033008 RepID=A0AAD7AJG4_9AGAR|nr:hypothetical protein DFH08DRAFT_800196 [Mycena albidolilacea]